jgi:hypothetical protein
MQFVGRETTDMGITHFLKCEHCGNQQSWTQLPNIPELPCRRCKKTASGEQPA